jgi:hypothetical protein
MRFRVSHAIDRDAVLDVWVVVFDALHRVSPCSGLTILRG